MIYKTLVVRLPQDISQAEYEAFFKAMHELNFPVSVSYALGDDIRNAKLLITDENGKIVGAQG